MYFSTAALLALIPTAFSHGIITTPPSRAIGSAVTSACGSTLVNAIKQDNTSYVEQLTKLATTDKGYKAAACNLYLCKGLQFADNTANVQTWKAGDVVPIKIWLRIPHEGIANVSVVDTKSNVKVGEFLKVWDKGYAPGRSEKDVPLDQKEFSITVPTGLETACSNAGDCVLQWWWLGTAAKQTYESCVDFKIAAPAKKERSFMA
ncbi:hypothetical protein K458DRAFT_446971 [Lentithecium fluviatile CBS 122367]|uniref:Chitin-binding type-4 domain-containing protein n=1 Tax=Lentithecium fluviatile CBS 122367 TaxID=1168545 RepID=A0A6G1IHH3_9PLEO|nr:hypothetical protein K458DRAFT_446971 [Lentithecium fluviatile CBS 122367]